MAALIAASVALGTFEDEFVPELEEFKESRFVSDEVRDEINKILREIRGPTSTVIAIAAVAIMIEVAVILTRFLNIGSVNANIKFLLSVVSLLQLIIRIIMS